MQRIRDVGIVANVRTINVVRDDAQSRGPDGARTEREPCQYQENCRVRIQLHSSVERNARWLYARQESIESPKVYPLKSIESRNRNTLRLGRRLRCFDHLPEFGILLERLVFF